MGWEGIEGARDEKMQKGWERGGRRRRKENFKEGIIWNLSVLCWLK